MKRIGVIAVSAGLVLALGACSSSSTDSGTTSPTSEAPATTAPAETSAPAQTEAGELSGKWSGQYGGTFQGTFVLNWQQSGSTLNGTINLSTAGTAPVNGTVNGSTISFGTVGSQAITYTGSVSGDSMSGTYKVQTPNGSVGGSWSATKD